jgi:hypothetical protein
MAIDLEDGVRLRRDHSPFQAMNHLVVPPRTLKDPSSEFSVLSFEFILIGRRTLMDGGQ